MLEVSRLLMFPPAVRKTRRTRGNPGVSMGGPTFERGTQTSSWNSEVDKI